MRRYRDALRRAAAVLSAVAIGVFAVIQTGDAAETPVKNGHGLLWRISGGAAAPSHLFGTIHVTDPRVHDLPAPVETAFDASRSLSLEIKFDAATAYNFSRAVRLPRGQTLEDVVGFQLYEKLSDAVWRRGIPISVLDTLKPWAAMFLLNYSAAEAGNRAESGVVLDHALYNRARARKIAVHALETTEEHLVAFDGLPLADQIALLRLAVGEEDSRTRDMKSLIDLYLARDMASAYRAMAEDDPRIDPRIADAFRKGLLDGRNAKMVERAISRLREGGAFIAVGALHLPGEEGMVNLLARRGYGVERIY